MNGHDVGGVAVGVVVFVNVERGSVMGRTSKSAVGIFSVNASSRRSEFELAAARAALRSIQESIGAIESLRAQVGQATWLRPPTKW